MRLPHMRYADLRRRLHTAYCYDSMGENPEEHGDPRIEDKLAEALQRYTDSQFSMLMEHMQWDLQLHPEGYREFRGVRHPVTVQGGTMRLIRRSLWSH